MSVNFRFFHIFIKKFFIQAAKMDSFDPKLTKCQNSEVETASLSYSTKHDTNCEKSLNSSLDQDRHTNFLEKNSYPKSVNSQDNVGQWSEGAQNRDFESELNSVYYTNQYLNREQPANERTAKISNGRADGFRWNSIQSCEQKYKDLDIIPEKSFEVSNDMSTSNRKGRELSRSSMKRDFSSKIIKRNMSQGNLGESALKAGTGRCASTSYGYQSGNSLTASRKISYEYFDQLPSRENRYVPNTEVYVDSCWAGKMDFSRRGESCS
jgi:hypothetical protein